MRIDRKGFKGKIIAWTYRKGLQTGENAKKKKKKKESSRRAPVNLTGKRDIAGDHCTMCTKLKLQTVVIFSATCIVPFL